MYVFKNFLNVEESVKDYWVNKVFWIFYELLN